MSGLRGRVKRLQQRLAGADPGCDCGRGPRQLVPPRLAAADVLAGPAPFAPPRCPACGRVNLNCFREVVVATRAEARALASLGGVTPCP